MKKIAIIGGGVAGGTAALYLSKIGLNVTLFDKNNSLVSGPPFCHLHAGGNLYREISDEQCITLLHQSIDLLRFYPYAIDYRPTLIVTPTLDNHSPSSLLPRLELLKKEYLKSIQNDINNKVLGEVDEYFKIYTKEDLENFQKLDTPKNPRTLDEWMIQPSKNIILDKIQFPVIMVQEYGLNIFRLSAGINNELNTLENCTTHLNTTVKNITRKNSWYEIEYMHNKQNSCEYFDYIINAAGYNTGTIDNMLGFKRDRFVEFKAAYVTKWDQSENLWPEIIFHGQRGTPNGMGQFTPYPDGYVQVHAMTKDITLFDNGLTKSTKDDAQPNLGASFQRKIQNHHWEESETKQRTIKAIEHLAQYIPSFKNAIVASKPLYGAQQIPGDDEDLRAADVSFENENYARCEVVKASSVLDMIDAIVMKLINLEYVDKNCLYKRDLHYNTINEDKILSYAQEICKQREYPSSLAKVTVSRELIEKKGA